MEHFENFKKFGISENFLTIKFFECRSFVTEKFWYKTKFNSGPENKFIQIKSCSVSTILIISSDDAFE